MTCEECGGGRFEFAGVPGGTTVRLRCTRCSRVLELVVDGPGSAGAARAPAPPGPPGAQFRTRV